MATFNSDIDRDAYFERCFPRADRLRSQDELKDGARHRNTDYITVRDGQVAEIQVFFGGTVRPA